MALIEEIEDDKRRSPSPIKIEEITDEEDEKPRKPKVAPPPPAATSAPPAPVSDFQKKLQDLTSKMALPSDLLPAFMSEQAGKLLVDVSAQKLTSAPIVFESYKDQVQQCLARLFPLIQSPDWASLSFEEQASTLSQILRLRGNDAWTSLGISDMVDTSGVDTTELSRYILISVLRPLFSPHPYISNNRAVAKPLGGAEAMDDLQETSTYKTQNGWGSANLLHWSSSVLPPIQLEKQLNLILPPTLTMMDDWEPFWRLKGIWVLSGWLRNMDKEELKRRNLNSLLLKSLLHTLSLHAKDSGVVLDTIVGFLLDDFKGEKRADILNEIVDKACISAWSYASGEDAKAMLIQAAVDWETMCGVLGTGVARWLKAVIPSLLAPLEIPPMPSNLPHLKASLSALLATAQILKGTGRISRWRGQILNMVAKMWVMLCERWPEAGGADMVDDTNGSEKEQVAQIKSLARGICDLIADACPSVRASEFQSLLDMNKAMFTPLVSAPA
ncbi:hypothetical protein A1Q2_06523 [Trichosporon asahii var. asahii CBS 8904]|uniref:Uncharacterized protein n=1 Tax=Trichosporon asahii var. asahii (strain CBS 8904) TaxID=1220162 RepID=K1V597_TRIAC|nr:hypothetical protein A1Q2_06523 [Trichosporon asahii var. asahii CBS 8904]